VTSHCPLPHAVVDLRLLAIAGLALVALGYAGSRYSPGRSRVGGAATGSLPALSATARAIAFQKTAAPHTPAPSAPSPPPVAPLSRPRRGIGPFATITRRPRAELPPAERALRLDRAVNGLRLRDPDLSAVTTLSRSQKRLALLAAIVILALLVLFPKPTVIGFVGFTTILYLASLLFRLNLYRLSLGHPALIRISDEEALQFPEHALPLYTVLVPAFNEHDIVERLIDSLGRLDYPADRLDMKLLLEEDDLETVQAVRASPFLGAIEVVLVPAAEPRTKPKALNYGLQSSQARFVTIYDAEDRPDPLQLRKAAIALMRAPARVACLQAALQYFNPAQNIITKWFATEYMMWFSQLLPGLSTLDAPVPLGGTSNHFRREILEEVGGWDPFNVTEDADLGIRLHRQGYRTGVLDSVTLEEANSDFVNWVRQRSRWYKGYMQAWLVNLRHPGQTWRDLGPRGFVQFNLFVGGTPIIALLNPLFWTLTIVWFVGHPVSLEQIFPAPLYYAGLFTWLVGNFLCLFAVILSAYESDRGDLFLASLITPFYWIMMSIAAAKAFYQLIFQPSYWEKTVHGLDSDAAAVASHGRARSPLANPA